MIDRGEMVGPQLGDDTGQGTVTFSMIMPHHAPILRGNRSEYAVSSNTNTDTHTNLLQSVQR